MYTESSSDAPEEKFFGGGASSRDDSEGSFLGEGDTWWNAETFASCCGLRPHGGQRRALLEPPRRRLRSTARQQSSSSASSPPQQPQTPPPLPAILAPSRQERDARIPGAKICIQITGTAKLTSILQKSFVALTFCASLERSDRVSRKGLKKLVTHAAASSQARLPGVKEMLARVEEFGVLSSVRHTQLRAIDEAFGDIAAQVGGTRSNHLLAWRGDSLVSVTTKRYGEVTSIACFDLSGDSPRFVAFQQLEAARRYVRELFEGQGGRERVTIWILTSSAAFKPAEREHPPAAPRQAKQAEGLTRATNREQLDAVYGDMYRAGVAPDREKLFAIDSRGAMGLVRPETEKG